MSHMSEVENHKLAEHITDEIMAQFESHRGKTDGLFDIFGRDKQGHQINPISDLHKIAKGGIDHVVKKVKPIVHKLVEPQPRYFCRPNGV